MPTHTDIPGETSLELRRNMRSKWIWVLLTSDSHVVNCSDGDFATRHECIVDANLKGFTLTEAP